MSGSTRAILGMVSSEEKIYTAMPVAIESTLDSNQDEDTLSASPKVPPNSPLLNADSPRSNASSPRLINKKSPRPKDLVEQETRRASPPREEGIHDIVARKKSSGSFSFTLIKRNSQELPVANEKEETVEKTSPRK